jgi:protein ImuB
MGLRACISVDCLPLQILLKANPGWTGTPVAVTKEEKPQSPILALNGEAREKGLGVGMRYANALSLVPNLRALAVASDRVAAARDSIVHAVSSFTPDIELCPFDTDALWVSVTGLKSLFGTEARWSQEVRKSLGAEGFTATVVVGFTRYGTYATARSRPRSLVFASPEDERAAVGRSPIDILPLPERTKSTLRKLEIRTVGQFVSLPEGETIRRFGKEAGVLWRAIVSDDPLPVQALAITETVPSCRHLDAPLSDLNLLMPHIQELLAVEAERAEAARSVISGLKLVLRTEDGELTTDLVRPASPTLGTALLGRLILLRLSARQFSSGVEDIEIRSARTQPSRSQQELFSVRGRDLHAGARAFAALRARFGNDAVTHAQLRDSYLPERSFRWVPMQRPVLPTAQPAGRPAAVRRIHFVPRQAPQGQRQPGNGRDPFILSGSWWGSKRRDAPFHREYSFPGSAGNVLWTYMDRLTDTLWVQGEVD